MGKLKDLRFLQKCLLTGQVTPCCRVQVGKVQHQMHFEERQQMPPGSPNSVPKKSELPEMPNGKGWTDTIQSKTPCSYIVTYNKAMYTRPLQLWAMINIHPPPTHPPCFQHTLLPGSKLILQEVGLLPENTESLFTLLPTTSLLESARVWLSRQVSVLWRRCSPKCLNF